MKLKNLNSSPYPSPQRGEGKEKVFPQRGEGKEKVFPQRGKAKEIYSFLKVDK